jgi:hypothetical protein
MCRELFAQQGIGVGDLHAFACTMSPTDLERLYACAATKIADQSRAEHDHRKRYAEEKDHQERQRGERPHHIVLE